MKTFVRFFIICVVFTVFSCSQKENPEDAYLEVSTNQLLFFPEGSSKFITVSTNREFSAVPNSPWCTAEILPASKDNLKITVSANNVVGKDRTAEITVSSDGLEEILTVSQLAMEPSISVREKSVIINENAGLDFTLTITANIPIAFDLPAWIHESGSGEISLSGEKTYSFAASALNADELTRSGEIIVHPDGDYLVGNIVIPVTHNKAICTFRIATYNILVAQWTADRAALVNGIIQKYDFDIFGTQEGTKVHLTDITVGRGYAYTGGGRDGGEAGEYSAIVYKTNRFQLLDKGDFWYSQTPDIPSYGWDATQYRRICSWGKFRDLVSGREFYMFNSHFDFQGSTASLESAKLLLAKIESIVAGDEPVFVTGDLNAVPESQTIQLLLAGGLKDSYVLTQKPPYGPYGTGTGFNPQPSTSRIDYIFVTTGIIVKEYGVLNDRPGGQFPSDHDPVLAVVEF